MMVLASSHGDREISCFTGDPENHAWGQEIEEINEDCDLLASL